MATTQDTGYTFGGDWTVRKLEVLRRYLDAYTTALKFQSFELVYIDSHAGEGLWTPKDAPPVDGSPLIALKATGRQFSQLHLNDADPQTVTKLQRRIEGQFPGRSGLHYTSYDADTFLRRVCASLTRSQRGVAFFDPFNSRIRWSSMEAIAATSVLDALVLFPAGALWRQLRTKRDVGDPNPNERNLTRCFGDETWMKAYDPEFAVELKLRHRLAGGAQPTMEGLGVQQRSDHELIPLIFKEKLENVFAAVLMDQVPIMVNGSPYFELIFAVSNPDQTAKNLAMKIFSEIVGSIN